MKPIIKIPVLNGVIAAFVGIILMIGLYYLGRHPFSIPIYADFRILLFSIFIFFTLKELRARWNGILYFWQGMIASFFFVATYAVVAFILLAAFASLVPKFLQDYIDVAILQLQNLPEDILSQIGEGVVEENIRTLPSTNAIELASAHLLPSFVLGFFISMILSVILRRQPNL